MLADTALRRDRRNRKYIGCPGFVGDKRDRLSIRRPGWRRIIRAVLGGATRLLAAVGVHDVNLECAVAPGGKRDLLHVGTPGRFGVLHIIGRKLILYSAIGQHEVNLAVTVAI